MIVANVATAMQSRAALIMSRSYAPVGSGGWWPMVHEPYTGAWQKNDEWRLDNVLAHPTVYACVTLIASDLANMDSRLVEEIEPDLWVPVFSSSYSPVLREPNEYQTEAQFKLAYAISKLVHGNTYVYQVRNNRGGEGNGNVIEQHVLDPNRVKPLVAPDGQVFYELNEDNLSGIAAADALLPIPASEIVHDRAPFHFHPLVGIPPLYAAGGPAHMGLTVQRNSGEFFTNDSSPPGILSTPTAISTEQAQEYVARWHARTKGKIAVLGNGLTYQPLRMTVVDAQTVEHLNWSDLAVCRAFKVPPGMVGVGEQNSTVNPEVEARTYLTKCLQHYVHHFEKCMDRGLGLMENKEGRRLGVELDKSALLQMDTATQYKTLAEGVRGGFMAPNEARQKIDLRPLKGGDTVYLQHQDYPIDALRDRVLAEGSGALPPAQQPLQLPAPKPDESERSADPWDDVALVEAGLLELEVALNEN